MDTSNNKSITSDTENKILQRTLITHKIITSRSCQSKMVQYSIIVTTCVISLASLGPSSLDGRLILQSLPDIMFDEVNSNKTVVNGSVLWLYCKVNSLSSLLSLSWNKGGVQLVQNAPHVRIRNSTTSSYTVLVLVIDNVLTSDEGVYYCTAKNEGTITTGISLNLTVQSSNEIGTLEIVSKDSLTAITSGNRTGVISGSNIAMTFTAGYVGDDTSQYTAPTVRWFNDGVSSRTNATNSVSSNGQITSTLSFIFQESDTGIYQCFFIGYNSQIFGAFPLRLDTNQSVVIDRLSPQIIFLTPPQKLVLEVRSSGRIGDYIRWQKGNQILGQPGSSASVSDFSNFYEVLVREPTTTADYGEYNAHVAQSTKGALFRVTPVELAHINLTEHNTLISVYEGNNLTITCRSTGGPLPRISWTWKDGLALFRKEITNTQPYINNRIMYPGHVVSTLYATNARYSKHDGVYTCTGTNSVDHYSSVNITVQVLVLPQIQLVKNHESVLPRPTIILNCEVLRGNPTEYNFTWLHVDTNTTLSSDSLSENSAHLHIAGVPASNAGTYMCSVENGAGVKRTNISISLAELNSPNLSTNSPNLSTNSLNQHDSPSSSTTSCKIEVYEANFTVFTLKWTPQMTSDGQYVVNMTVISAHNTSTVTTSIINITSNKAVFLTIGNLHPNLDYNIKMQVSNLQSEFVCSATEAFTPFSGITRTKDTTLPFIVIYGSAGGISFLLLFLVTVAICLAAMKCNRLKYQKATYYPEITVSRPVNNKLFQETDEDQHLYDECPRHNTQATPTTASANYATTSFIYNDLDNLDGGEKVNIEDEDEYVEVTPGAVPYIVEDVYCDLKEELYEDLEQFKKDCSDSKGNCKKVGDGDDKKVSSRGDMKVAKGVCQNVGNEKNEKVADGKKLDWEEEDMYVEVGQ